MRWILVVFILFSMMGVAQSQFPPQSGYGGYDRGYYGYPDRDRGYYGDRGRYGDERYRYRERRRHCAYVAGVRVCQ